MFVLECLDKTGSASPPYQQWSEREREREREREGDGEEERERESEGEGERLTQGGVYQFPGCEIRFFLASKRSHLHSRLHIWLSHLLPLLPSGGGLGAPPSQRENNRSFGTVNPCQRRPLRLPQTWSPNLTQPHAPASLPHPRVSSSPW